eukprot:SAG31_NODE_5586_length_2441_cov_1.536721_2_plen_181_part_00
MTPKCCHQSLFCHVVLVCSTDLMPYKPSLYNALDSCRAINQDSAGIPAVRVDGSTGTRTPILIAKIREGAGADGQMSLAECGGEPQNQKWDMGSKGQISNAATKTCLDVQTCQTWITYQACNKTSSCAPDGTCEWALHNGCPVLVCLSTVLEQQQQEQFIMLCLDVMLGLSFPHTTCNHV